MQNQFITDLILMVLGCVGLSLSSYIYHCKAQKKPLVCPMRGSCDFVTSSRFSTFLGCRVEILGACYYTAIIVLHGAVAYYPAIYNLTIARASLIVAGLAFLFSAYLVSVQAFVLKKWCTWCLCSALLVLIIFIVTYVGAPVGIL